MKYININVMIFIHLETKFWGVTPHDILHPKLTKRKKYIKININNSNMLIIEEVYPSYCTNCNFKYIFK